MFTRTCTNCGKTVMHKDKLARDRAIRESRSCHSCAIRGSSVHGEEDMVEELRSIVQKKMQKIGNRLIDEEQHEELMERVKKKNKEDPKVYNSDMRYNLRAVLIKNNSSGKRLVMMTKDFTLLKESIFSLCRRGEYENEELMEDFEKYGPDSFSFIILAQDRSEKTLKKVTDALNRLFELEDQLYGTGFIKYSGVIYYVKNEFGDVHQINNVKEFCLRNGLVAAKLYKLLSGGYDMYNGWELSTKEEYDNQ